VSLRICAEFATVEPGGRTASKLRQPRLSRNPVSRLGFPTSS
jgi:hypothetical protein